MVCEHAENLSACGETRASMYGTASSVDGVHRSFRNVLWFFHDALRPGLAMVPSNAHSLAALDQQIRFNSFGHSKPFVIN